MPFANNNGIKIHYEVEGQGPPLMMVHGFAGNLEHWRNMGFAKELGKTHQLILVDARGHGKSDKPHEPEAYRLKMMVQDLVAILDDLGVAKSNYYGYSLGGRIGFRIPQYAPERFQSLVIGGATYPIIGDEDARDETMLSINDTLNAALKQAPNRVMEFYVGMREKKFGAFPDSIRDSYLGNDPLAIMAANRTHRDAVSPKASEVLPGINVPCLIFCGEADPRLSGARECARLIPGAGFVSFPGLNHLGAYYYNVKLHLTAAFMDILAWTGLSRILKGVTSSILTFIT
jgi:pimeloyl-ACP methyl ester carboxylesterase